MTLTPLLTASPAIQIHAFAAIFAFAAGLLQFAGPKGTIPHRVLGWGWVLAMVVVAGSSFWIHELRVVGPWSPIHLLSILTLVTLPLAVLAAHRHRVGWHRIGMVSIFIGGLLVAGIFTFVPGRIMYAVLVGG